MRRRLEKNLSENVNFLKRYYFELIIYVFLLVMLAIGGSEVYYYAYFIPKEDINRDAYDIPLETLHASELRTCITNAQTQYQNDWSQECANHNLSNVCALQNDQIKRLENVRWQNDLICFHEFPWTK